MMINRNLRKQPKNTIKLYNQQIPWTQEIKYLGVTLDRTLNFNRHVNKKLQSAKEAKQKLLQLIGKNNKMSLYNNLQIYRRTFVPPLLYACMIWATVNKTTLKKINAFQSKFIRTARDVPFLARNEIIHKQFGIPTIEEKIVQLTNNFYEKMGDHPNDVIREAIKYPIKKIRKLQRPKGILFLKPP